MVIVIVLAMVQMACNLPSAISDSNDGVLTATATITLPPVVTATSPGAATATTIPTVTLPAPTQAIPTRAVPTQPPPPTATSRPAACTYRPTFLGDVSIPDDTVLEPGATFAKIWRVRNDGTCTWGANYPLHSLDYTGGSNVSSTTSVSLPASVAPGQTVDLTVGMKAPSSSGTYVSNWMFHVVNDPIGRGPYVGVGSGADSPLYVRFKVVVPDTGPTITRVSFAPGATQAVMNGTLVANETRGFVLSAMKDQIMMAGTSSASNEVKTRITAANGAALGGDANRGTSDASALLPSTQDYTVWITAGAQNTSFSLNIVVPARITFGPGESSASFSGRTITKLQVHYVIRAMGGQVMTVNTTGDVGLTIYGYTDGQPLVRSSVGDGNWTGTLPATQDYIIIVDPRIDSTNYTLKVTVVNSPYP
jgi:hypothetical protein